MGFDSKDWIFIGIRDKPFLGIGFKDEKDGVECLIEQFIVCLCVTFDGF